MPAVFSATSPADEEALRSSVVEVGKKIPPCQDAVDGGKPGLHYTVLLMPRIFLWLSCRQWSGGPRQTASRFALRFRRPCQR
jgi:hypothetical protein